MNKLKVAVIGVGAMGKSHARVYSKMKNVKLVAVCDSNKNTAKSIAEMYNANYYLIYMDMLKKENLDAISVCVPTILHKKVAIDVIRSNINVLVEKPIAISIQEAQEIIQEANKHNVSLMVGHIERFNPVVIELKKRIEKNELGKIYKVHCIRQSPFPQRIVDVGVIVDLAIHEIDTLQYLIKSKIKRLYAETAQRIHSTHEDLLIGTIRFENGILGVINANWLTPKKIREITITGEKGMFVANYLTQQLHFYENEYFRDNSGYNSNFINIIEGRINKIKIKNQEPLANELQAFITSILKNNPPPITGKEGLDALHIAKKFIESSKKNKVVEL
ncbi:Gfo/Idh/MocA family oxidoreductase [Candidatus Woesearchaeota archaeon]|nr:Gfo/Idh/MocA family oxidoreductase [Candidatus Woesearchaeota archaeon]